MPVLSGRRNCRVKFQRRAATDDGHGNKRGAWADLCGPLYARRQPMLGREEIMGQRLAGVQPFEFTVVSSAATRQVTVADCIVEVDAAGTELAAYDIVDVRNPDERNAELAFLAKTGPSRG